MRSRTNRINVWLSDEELADLNEKVRRVRGSRERFIRQCISGAVIREAPSVDVPKPQGIRAEPGSGSTYRGRLHEGLTAKRTAQL